MTPSSCASRSRETESYMHTSTRQEDASAAQYPVRSVALKGPFKTRADRKVRVPSSTFVHQDVGSAVTSGFLSCIEKMLSIKGRKNRGEMSPTKCPIECEETYRYFHAYNYIDLRSGRCNFMCKNIYVFLHIRRDTRSTVFPYSLFLFFPHRTYFLCKLQIIILLSVSYKLMKRESVENCRAELDLQVILCA